MAFRVSLSLLNPNTVENSRGEICCLDSTLDFCNCKACANRLRMSIGSMRESTVTERSLLSNERLEVRHARWQLVDLADGLPVS